MGEKLGYHTETYIYKYLKFDSGFNNEIHDLKMCASDSEPLNLFGCKWSESKNEFEFLVKFSKSAKNSCLRHFNSKSPGDWQDDVHSSLYFQVSILNQRRM